MEQNTILLIVGGLVLGTILGYILAKLLEKNNASKLIKDAKNEANSIIKEAKIDGENLRKEKELKAKEKFIELKAEHEKVILSRDKKMAEAEKRTRDKESQVSNELAKSIKINKDLEDKIKDYDFKLEFLEKKKEELEKAQNVTFVENVIQSIFKPKDLTPEQEQQELLKEMQKKLDRTVTRMERQGKSPTQIKEALAEIRTKYYARIEAAKNPE